MGIGVRYAQDIPPPPPSKAPEKGDPGATGAAGAAGATSKPPKYADSGDIFTVTGVMGATVRIQLTADCALGLSGFKDGQKVSIAFTQDETGGWAVSFPSNIRWPGGSVPSVTPAVGKRDVFGFEFWKAQPGDEDPAGSFDGFTIGQNL